MNLPIDEKPQGNILTPPKRDEGPMYTKKGTLRKRRPKTKNQYFTSDTEEAILEYLKETDEKKRNPGVVNDDDTIGDSLHFSSRCWERYNFLKEMTSYSIVRC